MQEYGEIFCLFYADKQRSDLEPLKEDLVKFLEAWISLASSNDINLILCSEFWPSFMNQLVTDMQHHNSVVVNSVFVILSNLTWSDNSNQLNQFLETDVIARCHRAICSRSVNVVLAFSIVQNLLISKPEFIDYVMKCDNFILDILLSLRGLQNAKELAEALRTLIVILKCDSYPPLLDYCIDNFESFAEIYQLISKSQDAECMLYIRDVIVIIFHLGADRVDNWQLSDNSFIQQVLESEELQEKLELGSRHFNPEIGKKFDELLSKFFD